jgi:hypothetical protein
MNTDKLNVETPSSPFSVAPMLTGGKRSVTSVVAKGAAVIK